MCIVVGYFKTDEDLERQYLCMDELPAGHWHSNMASIFPSSRSAERNLNYWRENNKEEAKLLVEVQIRSVK